MSILSETIQSDLISKANQAKEHSYSPYSHFRVGCALLTSSGAIYTGCNVENASYGGCICAERTAYVKAVSEGHREFVACAVTSDVQNDYCAPCGMCRQFMSEFGLNTIIILNAPTLPNKLMTMKELLPLSFGPADLAKK